MSAPVTGQLIVQIGSQLELLLREKLQQLKKDRTCPRSVCTIFENLLMAGDLMVKDVDGSYRLPGSIDEIGPPRRACYFRVIDTEAAYMRLNPVVSVGPSAFDEAFKRAWRLIEATLIQAPLLGVAP